MIAVTTGGPIITARQNPFIMFLKNKDGISYMIGDINFRIQTMKQICFYIRKKKYDFTTDKFISILAE